jgi:hypothetical protein
MTRKSSPVTKSVESPAEFLVERFRAIGIGNADHYDFKLMSTGSPFATCVIDITLLSIFSEAT